MASIVKSLRLLADPTRLRLCSCSSSAELSVAELQEILGMGQSRISAHLAQLRRAELVRDRRAGKNILYALRGRCTAPEQLAGDRGRRRARDAGDGAATAWRWTRAAKARRTRRAIISTGSPENSAAAIARGGPGRACRIVARAGGADRRGRSRRGRRDALPMLARHAKQVIAVDNSEKMVEFGAALARGARFCESRIPAGRHRESADPGRHRGPGALQPGAAPRESIRRAPSPRRIAS